MKIRKCQTLKKVSDIEDEEEPHLPKVSEQQGTQEDIKIFDEVHFLQWASSWVRKKMSDTQESVRHRRLIKYYFLTTRKNMWQLIINEWKYNFWKYALLVPVLLGFFYWWKGEFDLILGIMSGNSVLGMMSTFHKEKKMEMMSNLPVSAGNAAVLRLINLGVFIFLISVGIIVVFIVAPEIISFYKIIMFMSVYMSGGLAWYILSDITSRKNFHILLIRATMFAVPVIFIMLFLEFSENKYSAMPAIVCCVVTALLSFVSIKTYASRSSYLP